MGEGKHMSGGVGRLPRYPNLPQRHCRDTPAVTRSVSAAHPQHQSLGSSLSIDSCPRGRFLCPSGARNAHCVGRRSGLGGRRPGRGDVTRAGAPISSLSPPPVPEISPPLTTGVSPRHAPLSAVAPPPRVVSQVQGGHTEPSSQGESTQGHQAREEGRDRPRRAEKSLEVEEWGLQNFRKAGGSALGWPNPLLLHQRLCGSKSVSFLFTLHI